MTLPEIAKKAVEIFIKERKIITLENIPEEFLNKKSGVFVTIKKNGNLRGCIGTYLPTKKNIVEETICNAISAATEDWRFGPVHNDELPLLSYVVYILSKPEPAQNIEKLDPKKYGIIVSALPSIAKNNAFFNGKFSPKTGVLLPNLEGIETPSQQIYIACQKAGIDPGHEKIIIYRFTVEKHE